MSLVPVAAKPASGRRFPCAVRRSCRARTGSAALLRNRSPAPSRRGTPRTTSSSRSLVEPVARACRRHRPATRGCPVVGTLWFASLSSAVLRRQCAAAIESTGASATPEPRLASGSPSRRAPGMRGLRPLIALSCSRRFPARRRRGAAAGRARSATSGPGSSPRAPASPRWRGSPAARPGCRPYPSQSATPTLKMPNIHHEMSCAERVLHDPQHLRHERDGRHRGRGEADRVGRGEHRRLSRRAPRARRPRRRAPAPARCRPDGRGSRPSLRASAPRTRRRRSAARTRRSSASGRSARSQPRALGVAHRARDRLVRVAERQALLHQVVGEVGRGREALARGLAHPRRRRPRCRRRPGRRRSRSVSAQRVDGVEQRLLVFLVVLVVGERLALHQREQRDQMADDARRSCRARAPARRGSSSAA